ncbi:MAG: hypothetical protein RLZZ479_1074 [Bacteroidota bacterium]|jgi:hypothetical protein
MSTVPSNILKFAKEKGAESLVKQIARWAKKVDKQIVGGTAIGKYYDTLILDLTYQGGEIRINLEDEVVKLYGDEVFDAKSFVKVYNENNA